MKKITQKDFNEIVENAIFDIEKQYILVFCYMPKDKRDDEFLKEVINKIISLEFYYETKYNGFQAKSYNMLRSAYFDKELVEKLKLEEEEEQLAIQESKERHERFKREQLELERLEREQLRKIINLS